MKSVLRLVAALVMGAALCVSAHASIGQVKNLNASGSSVILVPGSDTKVIIIQNNGSNSVRLSIDGGTGTIINGKTGTNPTPTTGILLPAGQQITLTTSPYTGITPDPTLHKPIVAIMVTSTTTLDIVTDGTADTFPTT
jgi:hypothetical protein